MKVRYLWSLTLVVIALVLCSMVVTATAVNRDDIPLEFVAAIADDFKIYDIEETPSYFSKEHATQIFKCDGNGLLTNVLLADVTSNIGSPNGGSLTFVDFVFDTRIQRDVTDNGGALRLNFVVSEDISKTFSLYIFRQKYVVRMGGVNLVEKNFSTVSQL